MAASIDKLGGICDPKDLEKMKLSPKPEQLVHDIVRNTIGALVLGKKYRDIFRKMAVDQFDWQNVAQKFSTTLSGP